MNTSHNITLFIKRFRRLLLIALVLLCVWLYLKRDSEAVATEGGDQTLVAKWGANVEQIAREKDMPIFFSIKDRFRKETLSEEIIKKYFIYTELDPDLYPADYIILKALHCNVGENIDITCGVLTSKMYPILTSTNTTFKAQNNDPDPSIKDTLKGIVNIYHKNYNRFLKISKSFHLLNDLPSKYPIETLRDDMSKLSFMLDFGYNDKFKPAQISESARLIFRNCTVNEFTLSRTKLKNIAYKEILKQAEKGKELNFIHRSFYIRALSDYILQFNDYENAYFLKEFADDILSSQDKDGAFLIEGAKNTLNNAFSLTILSYAYKITGDIVYLEGIDKFIDFIDKELHKRHGLSADFKEGGISGAKGYVYLARALLNSYIVSLDKKSLELTQQMLWRLNKNHKQLNSMVLEVPIESTLSKYLNLCSIEDDEYTSTNGVLLQVYCDMHNLSISNELDPKIEDIFSATLNSPFSSIDFDFSLRLAKSFNPLIDIETIKRLNEAKNK